MCAGNRAAIMRSRGQAVEDGLRKSSGSCSGGQARHSPAVGGQVHTGFPKVAHTLDVLRPRHRHLPQLLHVLALLLGVDEDDAGLDESADIACPQVLPTTVTCTENCDSPCPTSRRRFPGTTPVASAIAGLTVISSGRSGARPTTPHDTRAGHRVPEAFVDCGEGTYLGHSRWRDKDIDETGCVQHAGKSPELVGRSGVVP